MSNKKYGLGKEREAKKMLESHGWQAHRCRGSFGHYDIVAHNGNTWKLVQIKATKQKYASFKKEIKEIEDNKVPPNTSKELWIYWSPRADRDRSGWQVVMVD